MGGGRLTWLDALRGLAILLVLLFHFTTRYFQLYPGLPFASAPLAVSFGWLGVHLFFLISGFIIYVTIQNKRGPVHFLIARLARLLPPFWLSLVLVFALAPLKSLVLGDPVHYGLRAILGNALMVPDLFRVEEIQGVYWSLFVEFKFYILFALCWALFDMRRERTFMLSFAALLAVWAIDHVHPLPLGWNLRFFPIFWLGVAVAKRALGEISRINLLVLTASVSLACTLSYRGGAPEFLIAIPVFVAPMTAAPALYRRLPSLARVFEPLRRLGRISYSFYLVHEPVGYVILGACAALGVAYGLALLMVVAVCALLACAGFRYIESLDRPISAYLIARLYHRHPEPARLS